MGLRHAALKQPSRRGRRERIAERPRDRVGDPARNVDALRHFVQEAHPREVQIRVLRLEGKPEQRMIRCPPDGLGIGRCHAHHAMRHPGRVRHRVQPADTIHVAPEHGVIEAIDWATAGRQHPVHVLRQAVAKEDLEECVPDQGGLQVAEHAQARGFHQSQAVHVAGQIHRRLQRQRPEQVGVRANRTEHRSVQLGHRDEYFVARLEVGCLGFEQVPGQGGQMPAIGHRPQSRDRRQLIRRRDLDPERQSLTWDVSLLCLLYCHGLNPR